MSYRGPDKARMTQQQGEAIFQHAGHTATWRKFVSATSGNPDFGLGSALYYQQRLITAHFRSTIGLVLKLPEYQSEGGQMVAGDFLVATPVQLGRQDELIWRGETYRIDSDSIPTRVGGNFMHIIKRGN